MSQIHAFNPSGETKHHNIEAEQAVLGAILCNNALYHKVAGFLLPDHFFDPVHAKIFDLSGARIRKEHLASPVTMKNLLEDDEGLEALGGANYLIRLAGAAVGSSAIIDYAQIVVDVAIKRMLDAAMVAARDGMGGSDLDVTIARLQAALHAIPLTSGGETSISLMKATTDAVSQAVEAYQGRKGMLKTGFRTLDAILKGLGPGDLMLLGGATSMGKTAAAIEMADKVSFSGGRSVAFWSLEMEPEQLSARMASSRSRVPYAALREAETMDEADFRRWTEAAREVSGGAMRIIPKRIRDIAAGHAAIKRASHEVGEGAPLSLIVVDYAQLIRGDGKTRIEQMSSIPTALKTMAGLLKVPVIALVQLDRNLGERDDPRPHLRDIKESGQFENDADQVVFCHREDYWLQRKGPKVGRDGTVSDGDRADYESDLLAAKNRMELIVRKNRHGKLATAEVGFHAPTNKFWDLAGSDGEDFR